jgi:uncharacterized membrane protein YebE (DUF533 family)
MNPFDILGSLMNGRMGPSAGRLERTFGNQGFGGPGGMFGGGPMPGGMPPGGPGGMRGGGPGGMFGGGSVPGGGSGAIFEMLGKLAQSMFGGGAPGSGGGGFSPFDILSGIGKSVFGGGSGGGGPTSAGWGANTVLGAIAAKALEMAKSAMSGGGQSQGFDIDDATAVIAGLRKPANAQEEQQVQDIATLTVRAMINAAKADGRIDDKETERLVGKLREDGVTAEEQRFVMEEMRKPMDLDGIVRAVPNQQVAAQIYTASLMAIEVDTDAEQRYMQELASKLGLNQQVVAYLHQAVGLA